MPCWNVLFLCLCIAFAMTPGCSPQRASEAEVRSPSGNIRIGFYLLTGGTPAYTVSHKGETVIDTSTLGFSFKGLPPLQSGLRITNMQVRTLDETWDMVWGEQRSVRNHCRELKVILRETDPPERRMHLIFRVYDGGVAFRYEFPKQPGIEELIVTDEHTRFQLTEDPICWWIPGDWDSYEHLYSTTPFSKIDAFAKRNDPALTRSFIPENAVNTPLTMRTRNGLHLSFHEADLIDYAGITLRVDPEALCMGTALVASDRRGWKVRRALPFRTPWRTLQISEDAAGLIESKLIVNLNEPNRIGPVPWFRPMKYVGIWWEMHLNKSAWDRAGGRHGATTENAKAYIDFAAANRIGGVLVEGWNTGWERWIGFEDREGVFDFVTPYPDYDLEEVVRYAKEKGVEIIMHHETSAAPRTYEQQMDTAYALMQRLGIHTVKTGYVGKIIPDGEYHHGQWMVNHYRRVLETAAEYEIAVNVHEPIQATGLRRTYPNAVSREGLRGQEFNAWSLDGGNPPEHIPIIAFTRMLAGPIDYTPGVFHLSLDPYKPDNRVQTTLAHQLALYVVVYSPIQMACDLIENYEGRPAFQFIRDVGVNWDRTVVLNGEVGDVVTIARKERGTGNWFMGSVTDENARSINIDFDFLDKGKAYIAVIYRDGPDAHWDTNPTSIEIEKMVVDAAVTQTFRLAPGGGLAVSLMPDLKK